MRVGTFPLKPVYDHRSCTLLVFRSKSVVIPRGRRTCLPSLKMTVPIFSDDDHFEPPPAPSEGPDIRSTVLEGDTPQTSTVFASQKEVSSRPRFWWRNGDVFPSQKRRLFCAEKEGAVSPHERSGSGVATSGTSADALIHQPDPRATGALSDSEQSTPY